MARATRVSSNRSKRAVSAEYEFLSQSIEKLMTSHMETQDAVLSYQTNMIKELLQAQNSTLQFDEQFYSLVQEVRNGYSKMLTHLTPMLETARCDSTVASLYVVLGCLVFSLLANLACFLYYGSSCLRHRCVIIATFGANEFSRTVHTASSAPSNAIKQVSIPL